MSFTEAISSAFSKYADFSGRARRSEYWFFFLFQIFVSIAITIVGSLISADAANYLNWIFSLATLVPNLSMSWRRLHDIGKSGAFYFFVLIPIVGWIILLVWYCTDSQPGDNAYGPNPKERFSDSNPYGQYNNKW